MLGAYAFEESGLDYSSRSYNIIYYIGVFFGMELISREVVKKIANRSLPQWGRCG
jgi:hypothetical protein